MGEESPQYDAVIPMYWRFHYLTALRLFANSKWWALLYQWVSSNQSLLINCAHYNCCLVKVLAYQKQVSRSRPDKIQDLIKNVGGAPLVIKLLEGVLKVSARVLAETNKAAESVIEAFGFPKANILFKSSLKKLMAQTFVVLLWQQGYCSNGKRQAGEGEFRLPNLHRRYSSIG